MERCTSSIECCRVNNQFVNEEFSSLTTDRTEKEDKTIEKLSPNNFDILLLKEDMALLDEWVKKKLVDVDTSVESMEIEEDESVALNFEEMQVDQCNKNDAMEAEWIDYLDTSNINDFSELFTSLEESQGKKKSRENQEANQEENQVSSARKLEQEDAKDETRELMDAIANIDDISNLFTNLEDEIEWSNFLENECTSEDVELSERDDEEDESENSEEESLQIMLPKQLDKRIPCPSFLFHPRVNVPRLMNQKNTLENVMNQKFLTGPILLRHKKELTRQERIERWKQKRTRRSYKRKYVEVRKRVASQRERKNGRFTSLPTQFVSISSIQE